MSASVPSGSSHVDDPAVEEDIGEYWSDEDAEQTPHPNRHLDHDISPGRKLAFSIGHFYNDLCASMWFTYLMIYLEKVVKLHSSRAGLLMLIGQVTDAISTPLVGMASDSSVLPAWISRIGKRMSWHVIGTICVSLSFPFIFNKCYACGPETSEWFEVLWFVPFIMVFQFGWASVQISHLALIPELSSIDTSRTTMNSLRYAFTVIANLCVFLVLAWFLSQGKAVIGPDDFEHFRTAGLLVVAVGVLVSLVFYSATREPKSARRLSRLGSVMSNASILSRMQWTSWFGHAQFYQIALLYMLSRLFINISQVYFPFYVTLTQNYGKHYMAILPMISYLSSFAVSTLISIPLFSRHINRKVLFLFGIVVGIANSAWMYFDLPGIQIYLVSVAIGISQAIILISSLAITADLINKNTESGAFVYGAMSFVDKLSNGVAYQIIELLNPTCDATQPHSACTVFYRRVMVFVPGGCLVCALLVMLTLLPHTVGQRRRRRGDRQPILDDQDDIVPAFVP